MNKMRVCFLIPGLGDGGAQKQCVYLLNAMQKRPDVDLHYIYMHPGVNDGLLVKDRLNVVQLAVSSNYDPRNVFRLRKVLESIQPDILLSWLHACDVYGFFVRHSLPHMRWIMTERDSFYPADPRYWVRQRLGRYADAIIANSSKGADYWRDARACCPSYVVPNIVHNPNHAGDSPREYSALFVGRLEPQKNVETVVRAFCAVAARRPDLSFKVVGDGSLRGKLKGIVSSAGVADRVIFLGFRADAPDLMARSRLVVSLSHHEGLPNAMLEGVAAGATIVASDIPEHRELLGPTYPYYVADRNNVTMCAATIERAFDPEDRGIGGFAMSRIGEMSPDTIVNQYVAIFRQVARR